MTGLTVLAVDLGKTSCRVRLCRGGAVLGESTDEGSPGLADERGQDLARRAILGAVAGLSPRSSRSWLVSTASASARPGPWQRRPRCAGLCGNCGPILTPPWP
ncbi:hypothetical protein ACOM2C_12925 [Pseudarthrobacter sp. So.54]